MALNSMQEIFEKAASRSIPFWRVVLETDMEERQVTEEQSMEKMRAAWQAMLESAVSYQGDQRSRSGLVGGDGARMRRYAASGTTYSGSYVQEVIATALSVGESNACMRKIVAAPTAGACGVLPAVLVPLYQMGRATEEEILQALYTASGIGAVVSFRACIAGASGGCQAEIGTASAMAAGALTSLRGGDPQQIGHAAAMALKNLMGLVCDPVAGLVEVPCVKRNVVGSVNAVSCADMALAGVESRIPVDEVIDCMGEVGRRMPMEMRETALGGLAATPTGKAVKERMEQLNEVIYRFIVPEVQRRCQAGELVAVDAINLIESGAEALCDRTVAVTAPAELRVRRIMARDGIDERYARMRISAQKSDEFYRGKCDYELSNTAETPEDFREIARDFFRRLIGELREEKNEASR